MSILLNVLVSLFIIGNVWTEYLRWQGSGLTFLCASAAEILILHGTGYAWLPWGACA